MLISLSLSLSLSLTHTHTHTHTQFTIAQNAPQFNNFQQQDAQELLSFLLDYLHEDLNRYY